MGARFYTINDPEFSEWVFHCMRLSSADQRRQLSANELKHLQDDDTIRRFAENESLDKRLLLMVRLGYSYSIISYPQPVDIDTVLTPVPGQYQLANKRAAIIESMIRD